LGVVSFAIVLTVSNGSLNTLYFDLQISLSLPIPHDVTVPVTGATGEVDHLNFRALGLLLFSPEPFPEEYELHS
jgi:hypothetical protein